PDEVEPRRGFSEMGFGSLTAVELRNQLSAATGLRLPATLLVDFPAPAVLAEFLRTALVGATGDQPAARIAERTPAPAATVPSDLAEPVAIVGMSCRFPGGVGSPEELWELLAA